MTYTLKSNATTAAATIVWVAENGLTNLVDASAVTATGTVATSTQAGKLVYGDGAAAGNYLTATAAAAIAAGQKFSILLVAHAGRTWVDDHRHLLTPSAEFRGGNYFSPLILTAEVAGFGLMNGGAMTGYSHPSAPLHTLIWGREGDNKLGTVYDGVLTTTAANAVLTALAISAGGYKFAGSPQTAVGDGARIFGVFVGVSPSELNTYLGADAEAALFDTVVVSSLSGNVTLDAAVAAGTLADAGPTALTGNVTLDAAVAAGTLGLQPGVITTAPWRAPVTGAVLASTTIPKVTVLRISDMAQVLTLTDQTTNGAGVLTITNAALLQGVPYLLVACNADGSAFGAEAYTAT